MCVCVCVCVCVKHELVGTVMHTNPGRIPTDSCFLLLKMFIHDSNHNNRPKYRLLSLSGPLAQCDAAQNRRLEPAT